VSHDAEISVGNGRSTVRTPGSVVGRLAVSLAAGESAGRDTSKSENNSDNDREEVAWTS
jgi:hypothetical protein